MKTTVVKKPHPSPLVEGEEVYIGRPSRWGNRYVIGRHGSRAEVISKYREYILGAIEEKPALIETMRRELRGKKLVCHCAPKACHGDVLAELVDASEDEFTAIMVAYEIEHPQRMPRST